MKNQDTLREQVHEVELPTFSDPRFYDWSDASACACGRAIARLHCPHCGGRSISAYAAKATLVRENGEQWQANAYRCRRCNKLFNDFDRLECKAPPSLRDSAREARIESSVRAAAKGLDAVEPAKRATLVDALKERLKAGGTK